MAVVLSFVTLRCKDLDTTRVFYESLGLETTIVRHRDGSHHYDCRAGSQTIELHPRRREEQLPELRLGFEVTNLGEVLHDLRARGVEVIQTLGVPHIRYAVVRDPDGHTVELRE